VNNINKKKFIFYKNLCITNKINTQLYKVLYKDNTKIKNIETNISNNYMFNKVHQNTNELLYLEQLYDCIEHAEKLNKKLIKNII
jgi:hypothetical protein